MPGLSTLARPGGGCSSRGHRAFRRPIFRRSCPARYDVHDWAGAPRRRPAAPAPGFVSGAGLSIGWSRTMRRARGLILALGMQALRPDRMRNRRAGRDRQRKRSLRCHRTNRLAWLIFSAVLLAGAEGAWTQAFADPGDAVPDSSIPPAAPAEAGTGRPGTERLGTALDRIAKEDWKGMKSWKPPMGLRRSSWPPRSAPT